MIGISIPGAGRAFAGLFLLAAAAGLGQTPVLAPNDSAERLSGYLRTLAGDPRDLVALNGAGRAALEIGDINGALGFYGRAEQAAPQNGEAKAGLGAALVQLEQPRRALPLFAQAVQLGVPTSAIAADRALAYDLLGDNASAQRDYAVAIAASDNDETRRRYALSLGIAGQRAKALDLLDPLVRRRDPAGWRARAFVLAMTGDAAGAESIVDVMLPSQSAAMQPFLVELGTLGPAQKAAAVNFGDMPAAGARGGAGTQLAARDPTPMPNPAPAAAVVTGAALVPTGAPFGARIASAPIPAPMRVTAVQPRPAFAPTTTGPTTGVTGPAPATRASALPPRLAAVVPAPTATASTALPTPQPMVARASLPVPQPVVPAAPLPQSQPAPQQVAVASTPQPQPLTPAPTPAAAPSELTAASADATSTTPGVSPAPGVAGPLTPAPVPTAAPAARIEPVDLPPSAPAATPLPTARRPAEQLALAEPVKRPPATDASAELHNAAGTDKSEARHRAPPRDSEETAARRSGAETVAKVAAPEESATKRRAGATDDAESARGTRAGKAKADVDGAGADGAASKAKTGRSRSHADEAGAAAADTKMGKGRAARRSNDATVDGSDDEADAKPSKSKSGRKSADDGQGDDSGSSKSGKHGKTATNADNSDGGTNSTKKGSRKSAADDANSASAADKPGKSKKAGKADTTGASDMSDTGSAKGERVYVQVAGGANKDDMPKAWAQVKGKAPELLKGKTPSTTPLRFTNRLLVGPFKDADEAQAFVNELAGKGMAGTVFKSTRGQKVEKVPTGK